MTSKERKYLQNTYKDKLEEIEKCLKHYQELNETKEINYFKAQKDLLKELSNDYDVFQLTKN